MKQSPPLSPLCSLFVVMLSAVTLRVVRSCSAFITGHRLQPRRLELASSSRWTPAPKARVHITSCQRSSSMSMSLSALPIEGCPLPFEIGPYSAAEVTVNESSGESDNDDDDDAVFLDKLSRSIDFWKTGGYTSAWVSVPVSRARLVERLASKDDDEKYDNFGFDLHHTNSTLSMIVLKKWLQDGTDDRIPPLATHQVGCAGLVLNEKNELLLIKEWSGPPSNRVPSRQWKMPGGLLDAGESFEEATCREVWEETGVKCDFEGILAFWHRHGLKWGKSDLYYVCLLRPRHDDDASKEGLPDTICPVEISAATWMHVDEFLETQDHPLITHVLSESFGLDSQTKLGIEADRIQPKAGMVAGEVRWPGREPYPTYTA